MTDWTVQQARELYNVAHWSNGFFDIGEHGRVLVRPDGPAGASVDLVALAEEMKAAGLTLPVLVRFTGILHRRLTVMQEAFRDAMASDGIEASYTPVYPIKVNQQRRVVEEIAAHDGVGLEAGSKPELLAVLAVSRQSGGVVICNGYKDREYVRLALIGRALGHRVYLVVEKVSELELILQQSRELGIAPLLGVRVRLASIGAGKWQNTGGDKSKFGLSAAEVLRVVEHLEQADLLDCLQLLHFHMGSQVPNIHDLRKAMRECTRYYAELRRSGVLLEIVDVGGGLGVDYEGTRSRSFCSMNYSVQEYATVIVHSLWEICQQEELPYPDLITESGRATTAHHAVLITNVMEVERLPDPQALQAPLGDDPLVIHDLWQNHQALDSRSLVEAYHEAERGRQESQEMFNLGVLSLEQRARAEQIYYASCRRISEFMKTRRPAGSEALLELRDRLADKYFCNFSLFQSLPDTWAINQIFPILPLQRLGEPPRQRGVIVDITCDSDGQVKQYVDAEGIDNTLPLHEVSAGESYLLGFFMVGAYQEILGDLHNLFGDTDSVNIIMDADGSHHLEEIIHGDKVEDVLGYVKFEASSLRERLERKITACELSGDRQALFLQEITEGLAGYTYLED
jgi:arginine decarboxylase